MGYSITYLVRCISKKTFFSGCIVPGLDKECPLFAFRSPRSSETSVPCISCVWSAGTLHFRSTGSGTLVLPGS